MGLKPALLLKTLRSDHTDSEFFGFISLFNKEGVISAQTKLTCAPFFLRSLAKPLQASVIVDSGLSLASRETAVACGSHVGEAQHVEIVMGILNKFGLSTEHLKCGTHPPLSAKTTGTEPVNNNCSGKHALMLALCAYKKWDIASYLELEHPLQQLIYKKHQELCEYKDLILSLDSCGTPIFGMPFENIARGYLNLFLDDKYKVIKEAFLSYPELIGGQGRLDTKVMLSNPKLVAKVGAGGFIAVLNIETVEILLIKMSQDNGQAREIVTSTALMQLGWIDTPLTTKDIFTFAGKKVAEFVECFGPLR